jgi:phosphopentomutase
VNKFVVIVLDGFGIGAMDDVPQLRPLDKGANTCGHILQKHSQLRLPTLEKLGLINALGFQPDNVMHPSPAANYGSANLQHQGADSFMGHQEIMGTRPTAPVRMPFSLVREQVAQALNNAGYQVERVALQEGLCYLRVNGAVAIGDNLETDPGQVYNVTANLDAIDFATVRAIGDIVRSQVQVSRVIVFGGNIGSNAALHDAAQTSADTYVGINAPKSGVYRHGFTVVHLGYGVDQNVQVAASLHHIGVPTVLIGKVADIVINPYGTNYPSIADSSEIMQLTLQEIQQPGPAFICTNIQETDLAGHAEDSDRYAERLQTVDSYLAQLLPLLGEDDALLVMADHGNDPTIGHARHTREKVPLLFWRAGVQGVDLGERSTLADVGATVCDAFSAPPPQSGHSFFSQLNKGQL